jgi:hypothetical protein
LVPTQTPLAGHQASALAMRTVLRFGRLRERFEEFRYSAVIVCNRLPLHNCDITAGSKSLQLKSSVPEEIWPIAIYRKITIGSSDGPPSYCFASIAVSLSALPTTSATTRDDLRSRCP